MTMCLYKGRTIRYPGGGGGLEFLLLANFFFYLREKTIFFFRDQRPTIFFFCYVKNFFCLMLSLLCTLPFGVFSGQHIFHQFRQQPFFLPPFSKNFFFWLLWRQTIFFQPPPPPQISNGASLSFSSNGFSAYYGTTSTILDLRNALYKIAWKMVDKIYIYEGYWFRIMII